MHDEDHGHMLEDQGVGTQCSEPELDSGDTKEKRLKKKMLVWKIWIGLTNNPLIDIFLYSHYLSA